MQLWNFRAKNTKKIDNFIDANGKLIKSKDVVDHIFETAADGMRIIDQEFNVLKVNETMLKMAGVSRKAALGRKCYQWFKGPLCHTKKCPLKQVLVGKPKVEMDDYEKERIDKRKVHNMLSGKPFKDPQGEVMGIIEEFRDITGIKTKEKELQDAYGKLRASEEELKSSNEEIRASEEELRTTNEGLKDSQEKIRETRDYLENLFNHANAPTIVWDKEFTITRFNHAFEHLVERSAKEIIGKKLDILFPKASRKKSMNKIARTLGGEYWKSVEIPILRKNGDVRLALWNSANIYAKDGKTIIATIAQGQDITERNRAQEALVKSEIKFRELYEGSQDGYARIDLNYRIKEFNSTFPKMLGYSEKELLGKNYLEFAAPAKWHAVENKIFKKQVLKRGYSDLYEKEFIRKDDTILPAQIRAYLIKDKEGNPTGIWGFIRDITKRKQAEENVKETRDYLDNLINHANAPIIVWDKKRKVTLFNHAFENLTGYAADEVLSKEIHRLFPKKERGESLKKIMSALAGERWESIEIPILCKDGSVRTALWNSANVYAKDGKTILATIAQGTDITEQKISEKKLRKAYEKLQASEEELRSSNEELRTSEEELRSSNEELRASEEELGSSNEELRASEEELRTTNEELGATNEKLVASQKEIERYNRELKSMVKERTKKLDKANKELKEQVEELERMNDLMIGRELMMIKLKKKIKIIEKNAREREDI